MLIAAVLCLCAAVAAAALGVRSLTRPRRPDLDDRVRRAVAPTQLAAALMLAAGAVVALAAEQQPGLLVLIVCVVGAIGTVAVGSWRGARFAVQQAELPAAGCAGSCAACTLSCH
jgi:hypothetical protein